MQDNISKNLVNELARISQKLDRMNNNHVDIGRLFKKWLEPVTAEMEELELPDRPAFTIGAAIRVVDPFSVHYKHIGTIVSIESNHIRAKFQHTEERTHLDQPPRLDANQIQLLDLKKLKSGDKVKVIDPHSMAYEKIGEVTKAEFEGVEVHFPNGDGGDFERRNLEYVDDGETKPEKHLRGIFTKIDSFHGKKFAADSEGRLLPQQWRHNLGFETSFEISGGSVHEDDLMTEEEFRIYNSGLTAKPISFHDVADERDLGPQYPRHWRSHFTMSALPANWVGADREDELMTEEVFRYYQAELSEENGR